MEPGGFAVQMLFNGLHIDESVVSGPCRSALKNEHWLILKRPILSSPLLSSPLLSCRITNASLVANFVSSRSLSSVARRNPIMLRQVLLCFSRVSLLPHCGVGPSSCRFFTVFSSISTPACFLKRMPPLSCVLAGFCHRAEMQPPGVRQTFPTFQGQG